MPGEEVVALPDIEVPTGLGRIVEDSLKLVISRLHHCKSNNNGFVFLLVFGS